jgi:Mrp family chromosome partitioning ATPase
MGRFPSGSTPNARQEGWTPIAAADERTIMSRMLEALKQIQAKSAESPPDIQPSSPEELEAFGLPPSGSGSVGTHEPATEAVASRQAASQPAEMPKTGPGLGGLRSLIEEHRDQYGELAENVLGQVSPTEPAALMFTSVADGEGKTSASASLAVMLAERLAEEIVLVDADFRNPALAAFFGVRADCGLVDVLTGAARGPDAAQATAVPGLSLLCGGRFPTHDGCPPQGVELSPVLEALRSRYRIVLLDTASLGYPEVAPMSRLCQGTYLVVRLGQTPRRAARRAVRLIQRCGGRVLGCVLTDTRGERLGADASGH